MVHSIYSVVKKDRKLLVSKSRFVFAMFDESVSKVVPKSMLCIGLSFYNVETHWKDSRVIQLTPLENQKADTLSKTIVNTLSNDWNIPSNKIIGASADNCSTNMGEYKGVMTLLRQAFGFLWVVGCMAHNVALFIEGALNALLYYKATEKILRRLLKFIHGSSKRGKRLNLLCVAAGSELSQVPSFYDIRWLSRATVIKIIFFKLLGILDFLKEKTEVDGLAEAEWLYIRVANVFFLCYLFKILDVICQTDLLIRYLQFQFLIVGKIGYRVKQTKASMRAILSPGDATESIYSNSFKQQVELHGIDSNAFKNQVLIDWMETRKTEALADIDNEKDRFKGLERLDLFYFVYPESLKGLSEEQISQHGDKQIQALFKIMNTKDANLEYSKDDATTEWGVLRREMRRKFEMNNNITIKEFWQPYLIERDNSSDPQTYQYLSTRRIITSNAWCKCFD